MKIDTNNRDAIREYLLGRLPEGEAHQLEEELLVDSALYEELLINEDELIDEYLHATLVERDAFESYFMSSPERAEKLRFARALKKHAAAASTAHEPEFQPLKRPRAASRFLGFLPIRNPIVAYSLAAALVLIAIGVSWVLWSRATRPNFPEKVLAVSLTPGLRRGTDEQMPRVSVAPDITKVRFQLRLDENRERVYKAMLLDYNNRQVETANNIILESQGPPSIVFEVPASVLIPGDYRIQVSGLDSGDAQRLATYYFRIPAR